jgi:hypothetical protein
MCCELGSSCWKWVPLAISCEQSNEILGCMKGGESLNQLSNSQLFKEESTPCGLLLGYDVLT